MLFLIERQGLLAERLQRLRERREVASREYYEADESGLCEPPCSPVIVPWQMMDEYR